MTNPFNTSDHGIGQAGYAPEFDRLTTGTHVGNYFCIVDKSADGDSTYGAGCIMARGDAPASGDPISTGGDFGQFTTLEITGTVWAYKAV